MTAIRKQLGAVAEAHVMTHLVEAGYSIYLPFLDNGPFDMIAVKASEMLRVSIKGTTIRARQSRTGWDVTLKTVSRRKEGVVVNHFDNSTCEILAIYIAPLNRVVLLNAKKVTATNALVVQEENDTRLI